MKNKILTAAIFVLFVSNSFSQATPTRGLQVTWLTGLTYGVSSYAYGGDPISLYEIVVDTGSIDISSAGPSVGIYTNNGYYFTYTLPFVDDFSFLQHINTTGTVPGVYGFAELVYGDSIPVTPSDCHASFFIAPDTSANAWVLYDFSTSLGTLTYNWDFGDGSTSTLPNPSHTYSALGNYLICLTISDGTCTDTYCDSAFIDMNQPGSGVMSIRMMQVTAGITENSSELYFDVYPNPVEDELILSLTNENLEDKLTLSIVDVMGRNVESKLEVLSSSLKMNTSQLSPGIYLLNVSDGKISGTKRFVKK